MANICWQCSVSFNEGIVVGTGGICTECVYHSPEKERDLSVVLPNVWGECASRLKRSEIIIQNLKGA